jgi:hypothetical protein
MKTKNRLPKKELRVLFTPEHYSRLEKQADLLDMTTAALVRMWAMEKVTTLEALRSQSGAVDLLRTISEISEKMEETRE